MADAASAPVDADAPSPVPAATPPAGPWALAWREFHRRRGARWGLRLVAGFWLLALLAPFLAHRLPLAWRENGTWSIPLLREFLAPFDLRHEGGLEQALAFVLLFLPLAFATWHAAGRWGPPGWRKTRRGVALALGAMLALVVCGGLGQLVWRAAGNDPLYHEGYAALNPDEILRPSALAAWIAGDARGLVPIADVFTVEERSAFARWPAEFPDAADPLDAPPDQRVRARRLTAGLNQALFGAVWPATPSEDRAEDRRARQLRAALGESAPPAVLRDLRGRLNRLALEANVPPDTVQSFRTFRTGFLLAALAALAAGLGVAAIIMVGANELRADGRWLILCLAAGLLLPLFLFEWRGADAPEGVVAGRLAWRVARNQPRDFRADAAAGKGWGIFPPLPYGPGEQGFGPKLPPDWASPSARLWPDDIAHWDRLADQLAEAFSDAPASASPALAARRHLWSLLTPDEQDALPALALDLWRRRGAAVAVPPLAETAGGGSVVPAVSAVPAVLPGPEAGDDRGLRLDNDTLHGLLATALGLPGGRRQFVELAGRLLGRPGAYDAAAFSALAVTGDFDLKPYLVSVADPGEPARTSLSPRDTERRNRLLLQKAFPGVFREVSANQWKKPHQKDGYHWFGTDESGRDVLVRMLHGARVSLSVGFVSVALATLIGLVAGALAAYYGGWVDWAVSRAIELMMCFPAFFLILALIAVLDKRSILNIMLVIGFTGWTGVARLVRGEILQQRALDYVASAQALGAGDARIIFRHILPNALAPVFVSVTFGITGAILTESGLSFLGLGVTPPTPTWGQLLAEAREAPLVNWWLAVFPGTALFLGVFSYNLVGEGVRDALDPRLRGGHQ